MMDQDACDAWRVWMVVLDCPGLLLCMIGPGIVA